MFRLRFVLGCRCRFMFRVMTQQKKNSAEKLCRQSGWDACACVDRSVPKRFGEKRKSRAVRDIREHEDGGIVERTCDLGSLEF